MQTARSTSGWSAPLPADQRNYPLNCWWVAAFSHEVGEELLGRWLLDTPVLLYRGADGGVIAVEDRCPHRAAPLSLGRRVGDAVECLYHGFTFDRGGRCIRVPTMSKPPAAVRIQSFPVIERPPLVWIYLGDPEAVDAVPPPPRLAWTETPDFAIGTGQIEVAANYLLIKENVLDLSHFGFVHANSFAITDWDRPPRVTMDEDSVTYHQAFDDVVLPAIYTRPLGVDPDARFSRRSWGSFVSPALQTASLELFDAPTPADGQVMGRAHYVHATTPIDATHTQYFWMLARDFATDPDAIEAERELTARAFAEDEHILEAVQAMMLRDPRSASRTETSVKADAAGIQARRIVGRWMARETA